MQRSLIDFLVAVCVIFAATGAFAKEIQAKDAQGRDYWLYTPDRIEKDKTYWLVIGVHGYRGNGKNAAGHADWAERYGCIVVGPSYDSNGYQYLQAGADEQTLDLMKTLRDKYQLHDKVFVSGFSGGAQFAHRFAMKHPDLVAGCAAHSGGTWGTGDYDKAVPNPEATGVPIVMSCGEKDTGKSFTEAPLGRLEWAKKYEQLLREGKYTYDAQWWPGVGHQLSKGARQMTQDCFQAATQHKPSYDRAVASIRTKLKAGEHAEAWKLIAKHRRDRKPRQTKGIVAAVYGAYTAQLDALADETDAIGVEAIASVMASDAEHDEKIQSIRGLMQTHRDGPRTRDAAREALQSLREQQREPAAG